MKVGPSRHRAPRGDEPASAVGPPVRLAGTARRLKGRGACRPGAIGAFGARRGPASILIGRASCCVELALTSPVAPVAPVVAGGCGRATAPVGSLVVRGAASVAPEWRRGRWTARNA